MKKNLKQKEFCDVPLSYFTCNKLLFHIRNCIQQYIQTDDFLIIQQFIHQYEMHFSTNERHFSLLSCVAKLMMLILTKPCSTSEVERNQL